MFEKLFGLAPVGNMDPNKEATLSKDAIAKLLKTSPEALDAFESAYSKAALDTAPQSFFETNSRQASAMRDRAEQTEDAKTIQDRIVAELLAQTVTYTFDGNLGRVRKVLALPEGTAMVSRDEIGGLPAAMRPQLSGELMKVDIADQSYASLFFFYDMWKNGKTAQDRQMGYNHFRQGLDILDLDPVVYEVLGTNRNSMGNWLPQLVEACRGQEFFRIPKTTIAKVPMTLLQLTRLDYESLTPATMAIVDAWAHEAFGLDNSKEYFIKTGTYSSKFDFRNAHVHGEKEVRELGEYLLFIHFQALQMASPLCTPCTYGVSTTNEWVVREFIPDKENNPCIYKGLPLHTEYRVFVDCDSDEVLGITPYWEPETMKNRFGNGKDANSPHQMHDYVVYKAHEETLMARYEANREKVLEQIRNILPGLDLKGQWSIDVMQNGDDFWIIDMAVAENSFFYKDCVPEALRRPVVEDWIPSLPEAN